VFQLVVADNIAPSSLILFSLKIEAMLYPKSRFLQEPHGVASQKTTFFISGLYSRSFDSRLNLEMD
jgi:hypothetical protein